MLIIVVITTIVKYKILIYYKKSAPRGLHDSIHSILEYIVPVKGNDLYPDTPSPHLQLDDR